MITNNARLRIITSNKCTSIRLLDIQTLLHVSENIPQNDARFTRENIVNPGLLWQKQHSAGKRLFSPVNWT
jgi:hypothetical protein